MLDAKQRHSAWLLPSLARFNDLSDARSHRLDCSLLRLPPSLWVLLLTNADLDNPLWGSWQVGPDAFQRALGLFQPASTAQEIPKPGE